jgi:hypothetical protein
MELIILVAEFLRDIINNSGLNIIQSENISAGFLRVQRISKSIVSILNLTIFSTQVNTLLGIQGIVNGNGLLIGDKVKKKKRLKKLI